MSETSLGRAALKARLRAEALARRDALSFNERLELSVLAAGLGRPIVAASEVLSGYWPIRSEADPRPLISLARDRGTVVTLPVILPSDTLEFRRWEIGVPLVPAGFGTVGPPPDAAVERPDTLVIPLAAFDRQCHRIGYGKGHYDRSIARFIAAGHRPRLIGLAFAVQEVENVPYEAHDIPLDFIVTEEELIEAPSRRA